MRHRPVRGQSGWALPTAMLAVALVSAATLVPLRHERAAQQRERETELLWIGVQYRRAITSYHDSTPGGVQQFPRSLQDLVEDKRFPAPKRHLRTLYPDPFTGKVDWTLFREQGAIVGIASRATGEAFKRAGFAAAERGFASETRLARWRFLHHDVADSAAGEPPGELPAAPAPAPEPAPAPAPPPTAGPERRTECLRALSVEMNACLLDTDATGCRARARQNLLACLRG